MGGEWEGGLNTNDVEIPRDAKRCLEGLVISGILGNIMGADILVHVIISILASCVCSKSGDVNKKVGCKVT